MIVLKDLRVDQTKMDDFQNIPMLEEFLELHTFLGLEYYCHQFVKNFSLIVKALTILTSKNHSWT